MKRSWISFICILLCVLLPFAMITSIIFGSASQFGKTFLGELSKKVERLDSIDEPKVIVVGGSSVPFGVDTKLLEEMLGMPCVNFGLYATLGTKMMLDISRDAINEGDIIILAPETDAQTYSLYFNAEAAWQACDSDMSLLTRIGSDNYGDMLGGAWRYAVQKVKYFFTDGELSPEGVYNIESFDKYGDIVYPRAYNIMPLGYDSSMVIEFSEDNISDEFIDYVNEYVEFAKSKGARVLFSFSPMNEDAISEDVTLENIRSFKEYIDNAFDAELISDPNDYIYLSGYFYDSNFHLNDDGATMHTANLAADIAKALGKELLIDIDIPDAPQVPETDDGNDDLGYDENEVYFEFSEVIRSGEVIGYNISGLSLLGKEQSVLTTPTAYNGKHIYAVDTGAFDGGNVKEIYISERISTINDGAFFGASNLEKVHIMAADPNDTTVNNVSMGLCEGMAQGARFYVAKDSYDDFISNYFWGPYADKIVKE